MISPGSSAVSSLSPVPMSSTPADGPASHAAPRCWHLLCQVIDNFGDAGVMWRLARQLRNEYGCTVRFFIDQPEIMQKLAPAWFQPPSPCPHIRIHTCIRSRTR